MPEQVYEEYWQYTAAWTDFNGEKFLNVLKCCIEYFDKNTILVYSPEKYRELQEAVSNVTQIGSTSVRKGINQMVKLGFLKPELAGYVPEAKEYAKATTDRKRKHILSKIVYKYSNFCNSISDPDYGPGQINFLLRTLEEVGSIDKRALVSLMTVDISQYENGYMTTDELTEVYRTVSDNEFIERKYNQLSHLHSLLSNLEDLQDHDGRIYFKTDAERLFGDEDDAKKLVRDPYLQRIYKSELELESTIHFNSVNPKCMLEGLDHPVLIASHIKPYKDSKPDEAFDAENGLLLSKNTDSLFDLGYMTFDNEGIIIPSKVLSNDMVNYLSKFRLHKDFMSQKRMGYMEFHREHVFEKRFSSYSARKYVFEEQI